MKRYTKTVRTGKFAKAGEDFKENDILTLLNEGVEVEGQFGTQDVFKARTPKGEELSLTLNKTSINNMIDAFGNDAAAWVGKEVKVWRILQNVQGKMRKVTYLSHPDAEVTEEGDFMIPGKQAEAGSKGVTTADFDTIEYPEEEVSGDDITFDIPVGE